MTKGDDPLNMDSDENAVAGVGLSTSDKVQVVVIFAVVVASTLLLDGSPLGVLGFLAVAVGCAVTCFFPLPLVLFRGAVCGINVADVALLLGIGLGARGNVLPPIIAGAALNAFAYVRLKRWHAGQSIVIVGIIASQFAITVVCVGLLAPAGTGLLPALWPALGFSYVLRALYYPLIAFVANPESRTREVFVGNVKAGVTGALCIDGMTACVCVVVATLVRLSPVALIPTAVIGAAALLSIRSRQQTSESAASDELTEVLNRRGLAGEFERHSARSSGTLFLLDADQFKGINDDFGHAAGDAVLRHIARKAGASVSRESLVARLGGDEFVVVVFGNTDSDQTRRVIADAIAEPIEGVPGVRCGVSIGAAPFAKLEQLSVVLGRADAEMYRNKKARRVRNANISIEAQRGALRVSSS